MSKKVRIKLIVALLILIGIFSYFRFFHQPKYSMKKYAKNVDIEKAHNTDLALDDEIINEKYKDIPSDIKGLSQYEKIEKGLDPENDSDTDYDGLTDKEELEIYGSDPLKTSTSGDLYSDGYKVANGLDINTFYENGEVTYCNIPPEFSLHARYASDNTAAIGDHTSVEGDNDIFYKAYTLSRFAGDGFTYDLSDICNKEGIDSKDIGVYIKDACSGKYVDCKYHIDGNIVSVECDFTKPNGYNIFITDKKALPSKVVSFLFGDAIADEFQRLADANEFVYYKGFYRDDEEGITVMPLPIIAAFGGDLSICRPLLYYNETDNTEQNDREIADLKYITNRVLNDAEIEPKLKPTTIVRIVNLYNKLEHIGNGFFNGKHDSFFHNALFDYILLSEFKELEPDKFEVKQTEFEGQTNFDKMSDTLPFGNFSSQYGHGGNCMGISTLISRLHNTGTNPSSGTAQNIDISWDISNDEENNTLTDPGLNDYKNADFVNDHRNVNGVVASDLSEGETEFIKMIGAYFWDGNITAQKECPKLKPDGYSIYSLDKLRKACRDNLNDKVLILAMYSKNGNDNHGHAINVYGYYDGLDEGRPFYLRAYDNNFPGEQSGNLLIRITPDGRGSFDYEYTVPGVEGYGYSSYNSNEYMFALMDEDFNVIFGDEKDIVHLPEPIDPEVLRREQELQKLMED